MDFVSHEPEYCKKCNCQVWYHIKCISHYITSIFRHLNRKNILKHKHILQYLKLDLIFLFLLKDNSLYILNCWILHNLGNFHSTIHMNYLLNLKNNVQDIMQGTHLLASRNKSLICIMCNKNNLNTVNILEDILCKLFQWYQTNR